VNRQTKSQLFMYGFSKSNCCANVWGILYALTMFYITNHQIPTPRTINHNIHQNIKQKLSSFDLEVEKKISGPLFFILSII